MNILHRPHQRSLLLYHFEINLGYRILSVKDPRNLLERGTLRLNIKEPDKEELEKVPEGVEEGKVPVIWQPAPCELICLATFTVSINPCTWIWRVDSLSNGENSLDSNVHNHHPLGPKMEW